MELQMKFSPALARALDKALKEIPASVNRKVIGQASRRALKPVVASARTKVPRRFGLLRKSLGVVQKRYRRSGIFYTIVGPRTGFKDPETGANPVKYAHLVELGTKAHTMPTPSGGTRTHPGAQAKGFLRKAFHGNVANIKSTFDKRFIAGVYKEAARHKPPAIAG